MNFRYYIYLAPCKIHSFFIVNVMAIGAIHRDRVELMNVSVAVLLSLVICSHTPDTAVCSVQGSPRWRCKWCRGARTVSVMPRDWR